MEIDKGLKRELEQAGLPSAGAKPFMLPSETARDLGVKCLDCSSPKVVYFITAPCVFFPPGAFCYQHLLARCRRARMVPYPIEEPLLDRLRADLGFKKSDRKIILT
ncbi:MAG: hypothetical protein A2Z29_04685 [Chloroflexi bacterium RBG_16_56_11]|nr:MAG: hypothetical protein A2Z29_04685 [Chloroflexi bacterium RBG_16_56_11]